MGRNSVKHKFQSVKNYVRGRVLGKKGHDSSQGPDNPSPYTVPAVSQPVGHSTPSSRVENDSNEQEIPVLIPLNHAIDERASRDRDEFSHVAKCQTENIALTDPDHPHQKESNAIRAESTNGIETADDLKKLLDANQLWAAAYDKIKDDPKVKAYETLLQEQENLEGTDGNEPQVRGRDWLKQVQKHAQERLEARREKMLRVEVGGNIIVVRDQVQKVIGFIVSAKDLVAAAISSEPHAALAWAGVMFIFPLLDQMLKQDADALNGFDDITTILVRCKVIEDDYLTISSSPSDNEYLLIISLESKIVDLYSKVYQYLISVIHHFDRSAAARYFRYI
ncbi:hypothetical protein F4806DRAFT_113243 [Annulohypoxylon nitens]|nr:hypothetical protein F4806DRAFT_113243 [Annulohypoxylon nitens]